MMLDIIHVLKWFALLFLFLNTIVLAGVGIVLLVNFWGHILL